MRHLKLNIDVIDVKGEDSDSEGDSKLKKGHLEQELSRLEKLDSKKNQFNGNSSEDYESEERSEFSEN